MKPRHVVFETRALDAQTKQTVQFKTTVYYDRLEPLNQEAMRDYLQQWAAHSAKANTMSDGMANIRGGIRDGKGDVACYFVYAVKWAFLTRSRFAADKVWDAVRFKKRLRFLEKT